MPAGFQLFGPDGSLWADTDFMPVGLIKSAYLTQGLTNITVTAKAPVIFFRTTGGNYWNPPVIQPQNDARVDGVTVNGSTWTFRVYANVTAGGTVSYYIFDSEITTMGNSGLQVFDANGKIIFNSSHPPLKVTNFLRAADEYGFGYFLYANTPVTLPAVAAFSMSIYRRGFTTSSTEQTYSDFYVSHAGITSDNKSIYTYGYLTETQVGTVGPEGVWSNQAPAWLTIADVSNCPVPFR